VRRFNFTCTSISFRVRCLSVVGVWFLFCLSFKWNLNGPVLMRPAKPESLGRAEMGDL
jgi:hypothetical protein